jgi:hypothetical protein
MLLSEWGATGPMLEDWLLLNDTRSLWRQMAVFGAISLESEPGLSSSFFAGQIGLGRSAAQGGVGVLPLVLNATHFALCLGERGGLLLGGPAPGLELGVWAGLLADPGRLEIVPLLELDSGDAKGAYAVRLHALSLGGAPVLNSTEAAALGPVLLDTDSPELLRLPASQFRTLSATFTAQACAAPSGTHGIACRLADLLTTQKSASASACLELSEADLAGLATDLPAVALALAPPQQSQPLVVSGRQLLVFERATPRLCARLAFASGNAPALGRGLARAFYMQLEPELRVLGLAPAGSLLRVCGEALSPTAPLVPRFALILIAVTAACLTCLLAAVCLSRLARSYAASSAPSYQRLPTESQD